MLNAFLKYFGPRPLDYVTFNDKHGIEYKIKNIDIAFADGRPAVIFEFSCQHCWVKSVVVWLESNGKGGQRVRKVNPINSRLWFLNFKEQGLEPPVIELIDTLNMLLEEHEYE